MPDPQRRRRAAAARHGRSRATRDAGLDRALTAASQAPVLPAGTFAELGLPVALVGALASRGIHEPFAIQARSLPDALAGRDVLGRAQTGSGKTLAFGLPILTRLASAGTRRTERAPRALVLVPTRELAAQVTAELAPLANALGLQVTAVYGGVPIQRQISTLRRGVDVTVATPGRLLDLLDRGDCTLRAVEVTVLDEADHMADLGFLPAVTRILDATPPGGQRLLFSATLDRQVERLVTGYLTDPALHAVDPAAAPVRTAEHRVFVLPAAEKVAIAAEVAGRPGRTLFFVRTRHGAARLAKRLTSAGVEATALHGDLNQNQRQRALAGFTAGHPTVLVATDVAARGIHIDVIDLVVHFDPPNDHKGYLHRSGRTARAGASGTVLVLAEPGQLADLSKLHDAAGVTPTTETIQLGDHATTKIPSPDPHPPTRTNRPTAASGPQHPARPAGPSPARRRRPAQRPATTPAPPTPPPAAMASGPDPARAVTPKSTRRTRPRSAR